jgi:hypothetical protein
MCKECYEKACSILEETRKKHDCKNHVWVKLDTMLYKKVSKT